MLTVRDIMTTDLVTLTPNASLQDAHNITRDKGIRHLPIVDAHQHLQAVVTQKALLARYMKMLALYGADEIAQREQQTSIMEVAVSDFDAVKADESLTDIGEFFLDNKHGCLPVVDCDGTLIGIVTSSDFVRLAMQLLKSA